MRALVTGASGFIGHHLVRFLKGAGWWVRGVDIREPEWGCEADEFHRLDLRDPKAAQQAVKGIESVWALAANMGGMGFIHSGHDSEILHDNVLVNLNTLEAAAQEGVGEYLYTSSACVYPEWLQEQTQVAGLHETDAYPAQPDTEYGWEKLFSERAALAYGRDSGMNIHIARLHNVYGPEGTWAGGREKAPAALCRKVAEAKLRGEHEIEVWGDGQQTRSFLYINDCLDGLWGLMSSDYDKPLNLGSDRMVSINTLAQMVSDAAAWPVELVHVDGPQGVRGRNADIQQAKDWLDWQPKVSLEDGIRQTYRWLEEQVQKAAVKA